jgi:hypothetical protein
MWSWSSAQRSFLRGQWPGCSWQNEPHIRNTHGKDGQRPSWAKRRTCIATFDGSQSFGWWRLQGTDSRPDAIAELPLEASRGLRSTVARGNRLLRATAHSQGVPRRRQSRPAREARQAATTRADGRPASAVGNRTGAVLASIGWSHGVPGGSLEVGLREAAASRAEMRAPARSPGRVAPLSHAGLVVHAVRAVLRRPARWVGSQIRGARREPIAVGAQ